MTLRQFMDLSVQEPITSKALEGYPHCTIGKGADFSAAMNWCSANCGNEFTTNSKTFWFDNESHAVMFKLVWG